MSRLPELERQLIDAAAEQAAGPSRVHAGEVRRWYDRVPASGGRGGTSRLRVLLPAGTVAAIAVLAILLLGGSSTSVAPATAAALRSAASVARLQPATPRPAAGQYLHRRITASNLLLFSKRGPFSHRGDVYAYGVTLTSVRDVWLGGESSLQRETDAKPTFPSARDRKAWITAGRPGLSPVRTNQDRLPALHPLDLPSDPDALYARLEADAADHGAGLHAEIFVEVGDALAEVLEPATPAQRAALYEVAARIPGVELVGPRTDPIGRRGMGFAMRSENDPIRTTLIIDPNTGRLLAQEQSALPDGAVPAGTVLSTQTYLPAEIVDRIPDR
jgi:hypothetical protein